MFRFIWKGWAGSHAGQFDAGLGSELFAPLAMAEAMEGLPVVMKFPYIPNTRSVGQPGSRSRLVYDKL